MGIQEFESEEELDDAFEIEMERQEALVDAHDFGFFRRLQQNEGADRVD